MKRFIAILLAGIIGAMGLTLLVAGPASATHPGVDGTSDCTSITWKVYGDRNGYENTRGTITEAKVDGATVSSLVGKRVKGSTETQTYTLSGLGNNVSKTLRVVVLFDNNHSAPAERRTTTKSGQGCAIKPPDKVHEESRQGCLTGVEKRTGTEAYVWNGQAYVLSGNIVWGNWTKVRDLTPAEEDALNCFPCDDECALPVMPRSKGNLVCNGSYHNGVYTNVRVPFGATCVLTDVYVNGSVTARGAQNLRLYNTTVRGNVNVKNLRNDLYFGSADHCAYDPKIGGSLVVEDSHNVLVCIADICKDVVLRGNDGRITLNTVKARKFVIKGNNKFVRDAGDNDRWASTIRLIHVKGKFDISNNAPRKITRR